VDKRLTIQVNGSFQEEAARNAFEDKLLSPDECLDLVERLRLEAGKLIYEYPAGFQRVLTVTRKE
jgi:hypothetical protein